ncbi:MAG: hypothetical protein H7235_03625, partial [Bdellovibrionaceae bacterium]|nr:hypothetical protein [Pseudobdellovibrionaceae bacterium]
ISGTMKGISEAILKPNIQHFTKCDPDYGQRIAAKLGIKL